MKTRIIFISVVIALSASFADASAQNINNKKSVGISDQQVKISIDENNLIAVEYINISDKDHRKLSICIYDDFGYMVFQRPVSKQEKRRTKYDLARLPDGDYNFGIYSRYHLVYSEIITKEAEALIQLDDDLYLGQK